MSPPEVQQTTWQIELLEGKIKYDGLNGSYSCLDKQAKAHKEETLRGKRQFPFQEMIYII